MCVLLVSSSAPPIAPRYIAHPIPCQQPISTASRTVSMTLRTPHTKQKTHARKEKKQELHHSAASHLEDLCLIDQCMHDRAPPHSSHHPGQDQQPEPKWLRIVVVVVVLFLAIIIRVCVCLRVVYSLFAVVQFAMLFLFCKFSFCIYIIVIIV